MTDGRYYDDGDGRALLSNNLSTSGGLWLWRGEEVPQHFLLEYDCVLLFEGKTQILSCQGYFIKFSEFFHCRDS